MDYVYHGSPVGGLTYIEPQISTHGKNWVYATKDKAIALMFLQKWNDFLINQSINDDGQQELTERLPNIFEDTYKGKSGYIYYLNSVNFIEGQTSFSPEVVSEKTVQVIFCEFIEDCYEKLLELENENKIVLFRYPNRSSHIPLDDFDLIEKTKHFLLQSQDKQRLVDYVIEKHPKLNNELLSLLKDG